MRKLSLSKLMGLSAMSLALVVAACGGGDEEKKGAAGQEGKTGGVIKVSSAVPDFLDPGLSYTVDGWQALNLNYPGLVGYKREPGPAGAEVVPVLAEDLPEVSEDGKTYTFKLREGLTFSDGSPLRASDFKGSIERLLEMDSQGAGLGYTNIVGGETFLKRKRGGVDGIEVDDDTGEIVIRLEQPRGAFLYELAIPFAGVVPKDTPAKNQTKDPPPGAGLYQISDVEVNRSYKMTKNKSFSDALKDTPAALGKADGFDVTITDDSANATTQIATNRVDFYTDNPAPDRVSEIKTKYKDRFAEFTTNSTFYFFMNAEAPPFDKLEVRQAVNHALDPDAINRVQGGRITPANTTLPPGVPGYEKTPDLYPYDLEKAKQMIKDAGVEGDRVTVWGNPENPTRPTIEYYTEVLNSIGLDAKAKIVPTETYFTTIGDRSAKVQTGWANWFQDYPHPSDFIDILLNPDKVVDTGNNNYSYNADDKELAKQINELNKEPELTPEVTKRWAEVDRYIQEKAYWGIYGNRKQTTFFSERMDFENCKGQHVTYTQDWAEMCLK